MLTDRYDAAFLKRNWMAKADWKPFPPASDRESWETFLQHPVNARRAELFAGRAEQITNQPWPQLPATLFMKYARSGNRADYEKPYNERRRRLSTLVLSECMEGDGRFLDDIADGLWAVTEEATWSLPAHIFYGEDDVLPPQDKPTVDLFASQTAMLMAETLYLLENELMALSPALYDRVRSHVLQRVLCPIEEDRFYSRFWWNDPHNNWSPWCCSNILGAAMYLFQNETGLIGLTETLMRVVEDFIGTYGEDGGCDEGPGYWNHAAGALLFFLELLYSRTDGAVNIYHEPKVQEMARFILRAQIVEPWQLNFADAPARSNMQYHKVYRFGERIGDENLMNLALWSMRDRSRPERISSRAGTQAVLQQVLRLLFWIPPDAEPRPPQLETVSWLPDIQVLAARQSAEHAEQGVYLAAKGGHNEESHNHNDIGEFIVFVDGHPAVIDTGPETYKKKTFSSERYDIWTMRSLGHNVPLINGVEQVAGKQYRATDVQYSADDSQVRLGMDIAGAYPEAAQVRYWRRRFVFDRAGPTVRVSDSFEIKAQPWWIELPLYAAVEVVHEKDGCLRLCCPGRDLFIAYPPADLDVRIERLDLEDPRLRGQWGDKLFCATFSHKQQEQGGLAYTLEIFPER